jgi:uncharacterized membrane protein YgaE (UPF0421/DUF939 family)
MEKDVERLDVKVEEMASHLISNMVFYRTNQISRYRKKLGKNIERMYEEMDTKRRDQICDDIKKNIDKIQEMIVRNIDDVNNLELTILTFRETKAKDKYSMGYIW